jgi:anti-sigma-K factor RskA
MHRASVLAFAAAAFLAIDLANWFAEQRNKQPAPKGLSANDLVKDSGLAAASSVQQTLLGEGSAGALSASWGSPSGGEQL